MSAPYAIGIVGYGYVGKSVYNLFKDWEPKVYDPAYQLSDGSVFCSGFGDLCSCDLIVVCVPTPSAPEYSCDLSIIKETLKKLAEAGYLGVVLIKSAVVPLGILSIVDECEQRGYGFSIVVSPEYIGEGNYFIPFWKYPHPTDMSMHSFQIFGGHKKATSHCVDVFVRKIGPECQFYQTDIKTAALCKYMENCWNALKVTFANQFYDIAQKYNIDYNELRELWCADTRVGKPHTAVFPKSRGYGGKCLSKDPIALIRELQDYFGYTPSLLQAMEQFNNEIRKTKDEE